MNLVKGYVLADLISEPLQHQLDLISSQQGVGVELNRVSPILEMIEKLLLMLFVVEELLILLSFQQSLQLDRLLGLTLGVIGWEGVNWGGEGRGKGKRGLFFGFLVFFFWSFFAC
jgi:hypothetical protein